MYAKQDTGGGDSKYRKLKGIGEFAKRTDVITDGRKQSAVGADVGHVHEQEDGDGEGEYP